MFQPATILKHWATGLVLAVAGLTLGACMGTTSLDQLAGATPSGSAFTQALFQNYAFLARSFGDTAPGGVLDTGGTLFGTGNDTETLAQAFATKALIAAKGTEVEPEPASSDAAALRERLVRALAEGRDRFPSDAARAQADFDCWMLNGTVAAQAAAADQCRGSFNTTLARLEGDMHPRVAYTPPVTARAASSFTVYFDHNSRTLDDEQMAVLRQVIAAARAGGQTRITVVGHTDTSGSTAANQALSVKRADMIADALAAMGARREAIQTSGVGEADLAVQTGNGVKEIKNRRAVVTLLP